MEPTRNSALVDLMDRILDKGVILYADLIISVSGIPLIGVNLKAAIAGMKTMLDYGMMEAWDEKIRGYALEIDEEVPLDENEKITLRTFASYRCRDVSLPGVWRSGYLYLTNKRLFLFRKKPAEKLFETTLDKIKGLSVERNEHSAETLLLLLKDDQIDSVTVLRTEKIRELKEEIEKKIENIRGAVRALPSTC